ncbi:MAG TPA: tetratricopeptide repeat protein [Thermoanaerobaculia bacterium]|nr:tetratricopeptide repeat protein [Thermoanaerobaculia bacterium]
MRDKTLRIVLTALLLAGAGVAEAGWEEGVAAYRAGNLDVAAQEFRAVAQATPEFAGAHFMLGQVLLKQDKGEEALAALRKAYELDKSKVEYQFLLAQAYLKTQRFGDAASLLKTISPSSLPAANQAAYHQMLAVALQESGQSGEALKALEAMVAAKPDDSDAWYAYGTAAYSADRLDTALQALEKAVELDGNDPRKHGAYAKALVRKAGESQNDATRKATYAQAVEVVADLAAAQPTYDNVLMLGEVQLGASRYEDAVASFEQAAAQNADDFLPHFYIAQAQTLLGQYDAAEAAANAALEKAKSEENRQRVWRQIGFANEKQREYDAAIEAYRKAGDTKSVTRVTENQRIASENRQIDAENAQIEQMEEERRRLEEELRELGGPPRR